MSSNIYEDPNVKYSKGASGDGEDAVETLVDIYESVETLRYHHVGQDRGSHTKRHPPVVQKNPFRVAALTLGLLCLLLVSAVIILSVLNFSVKLEKQNPSHENQKLQSKHDSPLCQLPTQRNVTGWKRFQCRCYFKSDGLKTWADSRKDCQSSGGDLVVINSRAEHEFVKKLNGQGDSWIGLQSLKKDQGSKWEIADWEWKWVDSSTPTYRPWHKDVSVKAKDAQGSTAYIDGHGTWTHAKNGTKGWICERDLVSSQSNVS